MQLYIKVLETLINLPCRYCPEMRFNLFKASSGVGDMKSIYGDKSLSAGVISKLKELASLDQKAQKALSKGDFPKYQEIAGKQLALLHELEHFIDIRTIRMEYALKDVDSRLKDMDAQIREQLGRTQASSERKDIQDRIRMLDHLRSGFYSMRQGIRDACQNQIRKLGKIYRFA